MGLSSHQSSPLSLVQVQQGIVAHVRELHSVAGTTGLCLLLELVLYGIRLLEKQLLGTVLNIEWTTLVVHILSSEVTVMFLFHKWFQF